MTTINTITTNNSTNNKLTILQHIKYEHLIAGISGGLTSTLLLHPLELLKIRFAVNDGRTNTTPKYRGIVHGLKTIFLQEGFTGLYKGVIPNIWGSASSWGLYFLFYNSIKTWIQGGDKNMNLGPKIHMLAASQAGVMTLLITNPVWVVKTRLCLQYFEPQSTKLPSNKVYNGMIDALYKIYISEGIKGFYKGLIPGIFGVSHGVVQFVAYEEMKNQYNSYKNVPIYTKLGTTEYLTFAAVSKIIAVAGTYPYQVVRARLQGQYQDYGGLRQCIKRTWEYEGLRGFYKGMGTNLLRVTPATMITFLTYENVSYYLMNRNKKAN